MHAPRRACLVLHSLMLCSLAATGSGLVTPALAQGRGPDGGYDSAFLACARFEDRGQRIACLEDALDAAVAAQAGSSSAVSPAPAAPAAPVAPAAPATAQAPAAPQAPAVASPTPALPATAAPGDTAGSDQGSLLDRIRKFGQNEPAVSLSIDDSGQDRLHDSIAALEKRNNLWIVTLSSGQVWRQTYPRNLLLREGDEIEIYREGIGNAFRLATPRLSGFIRVERIK